MAHKSIATKRWGRECSCKEKRKYSDKYDAFYCEKGNIWLEPKCSDKKCEFCSKRPLKPNRR